MGSGNLLKVLAESNPAAEMHGTDFNVNIKKIENARVTISDCRKLPYKSSSFDVVFALDVLEHIKNVDVAIDEIYRVLDKQGVFIITAPTENLLQKAARFILSGAFSRKKNKGSGVHYYNAQSLKKHIKSRLKHVTGFRLPWWSPFPILKIMKFCKESGKEP